MDAELKAKLNAAPPNSALRTRAQAGQTLTYIEGQYVIEKMNEIFGPDLWERRFVEKGLYVVNKEERTAKDRNGQERIRYDVAMLCEYEVTSGPLNTSVSAQDVGYGIGQSYNSWGDAFESAAKEAVTDALKRCCRSLGNALGNCLYDKTWLKDHDSKPQEPEPGAKPQGPPEKPAAWQPTDPVGKKIYANIYSQCKGWRATEKQVESVKVFLRGKGITTQKAAVDALNSIRVTVVQDGNGQVDETTISITEDANEAVARNS